MKRGLIYRLNHDVRNVIETMEFQHRLNRINNEYRQVFYFFDTIYDYKCPNPHGRCVGRWQNVKIHWLNGQKHRKQGPAIESTNGYKAWYYTNQLHRLDGPAIEYAHSYKAWFYKGRQHRNSNDGPAVEFAIDDRPNEYWEFGKRVK